MWSPNQLVAPGDLVILWLTRDDIQPLVITPGKDYNNKFGNYRHSDLVGKPYGSKVASRNGRGFIHILRPTPELWTMALPHRTQILYLADIAFVTSHLDIRPGSVVIEAGQSYVVVTQPRLPPDHPANASLLDAHPACRSSRGSSKRRPIKFFSEMRRIGLPI
ncbi:hypothetical protein AX16_008322 [Volvariella volvacea WC 439]|nr:hypothetical protein AX16_008322 [Volvariella volvacea WC 439]